MGSFTLSGRNGFTDIRRWLALLLASTALFILLSTSVITWREAQFTGLREQYLGFYLHGLVSITKLEREVASLNDAIGIAGDSLDRIDGSHVHLYIAGRELLELEEQYPQAGVDATTVAVLQSVRQRFVAVSALFGGGTGAVPDSDPGAALDSLRLALTQLSRLYESGLLQRDERYDLELQKNNIVFFVALAILLAAIITFAFISLRQINRALRQLDWSECKLVQLNTNLEERVATRTEELQHAHDKLLRSEKLAAVGQLTATVAHELRNPMGAIRNTAFTLGRTLIGSDIKITTLMQRIDRNVERCDNVINELLDFSRESLASKKSIVLETWLDSVLDDYNLQEGISLTRDINGETTVVVDPLAIERALVNVLDNAVQALEDKWGCGARIDISTDQINGGVCISICDNGPGIPEDSRERVFEPLYSTKAYGVGLGMPTVKKILGHHHGTVELGSGRQGGARICLWLPSETGG